MGWLVYIGASDTMLPLWRPSSQGQVALPSAGEVQELATELKVWDSRELSEGQDPGTTIIFKVS